MMVPCVFNWLAWSLGPVDTFPVHWRSFWDLRSSISLCICSMYILYPPPYLLPCLSWYNFLSLWRVYCWSFVIWWYILSLKLIYAWYSIFLPLMKVMTLDPSFGLYPRPLLRPNLPNHLPLPPYLLESLPPYPPLPLHLPISCTLMFTWWIFDVQLCLESLQFLSKGVGHWSIL